MRTNISTTDISNDATPAAPDINVEVRRLRAGQQPSREQIIDALMVEDALASRRAASEHDGTPTPPDINEVIVRLASRHTS